MQSTNSPASRSQPKASRTSSQKNQALLVGVICFILQARRREYLLRNHDRMFGPHCCSLADSPASDARWHRAAWTSFLRIPDLGSSVHALDVDQCGYGVTADGPFPDRLGRIVANCPPVASRGSPIWGQPHVFTHISDPCLLARQVDKSCQQGGKPNEERSSGLGRPCAAGE